jgi:MFS family permease
MGIIDATIFSMFVITALSNSAYAIIAPFLPFEFEKKGISQSMVGYIFSIYSVAVIVSSPLIGKMLGRFGRRTIIQMGVLLMGLSFILFSGLNYLSNTTLYIVLVSTVRLLQGFASSCIQTTSYSICTNFYPEKKEALVGYIEAVTGIGLILGPIIGSLLYALGGFTFTFFIFGSIFIIAGLFVKLIFPQRLDE